MHTKYDLICAASLIIRVHAVSHESKLNKPHFYTKYFIIAAICSRFLHSTLKLRRMLLTE